MIEWIESHKETVIFSLVGFFGGGLCRFLYERFLSERAVPTEKLLTKFAENPNQIGDYGRRRLHKESMQALADWTKRRLPPTIGNKLEAWPDAELAIIAKNLSDDVSGSKCPRLADEDHEDRPLYLATTANSESDSDGDPKKVIASVVGQITRLAEQNKVTASLIRYRASDDCRLARVWVSAPHLKITSADAAYQFAERLADEIREWMPGISLAIEIPLSDDIQHDLRETASPKSMMMVESFVGEDSADNLSSRQTLSSSESYSIARTLAFYQLKQGAILDVAEPSLRYPVVSEILEDRFSEHFPDDSLALDKWQCLSIFGPPGSGKSDLARRCADHLISKHRSLVVALSTEGSLAALEFLTGGQKEEEARQALAFAVKKFMPNERSEDEDWIEGFTDAFVRSALSRSNRRSERKQDAKANESESDSDFKNSDRLVFLIDDLLPRNRLKDIITHIATDSGAKPHLMLVGRPRLEFLPKNTLLVQCQHWGRGDATKLLRAWADEGFKAQAAKALKSGWAANRKSFSTYHLRMLIQYVDRPELAPSTFMRQELTRMTAPLAEHLLELHRPAERVLDDVKTMLVNGTSPDQILETLEADKQIDVVSLLGRISWSSKYNDVTWSAGSGGSDLQVLMNRDRLVDWSVGQIRDLSAANSFIHTCAQAGIFRQLRGEGGAEWIDNFIADGFAAHYIGTDMLEGPEAVGEQTIAELVEKLYERNSLDILPFALRSDQLMRVIRAVVLKKPHLVHAVNSLLTDETVSAWLKDEPRLADDLTGALLEMAREVDPLQMGPLGVAFAEMVSVSTNAADLEKQSMGQSSAAGMLALASLAARSVSIADFYAEADALGVSKGLSTETSFWFAHQSRSPDFRKRIGELAESGTSTREIRDLWKRWCSNSEAAELSKELYALLEGGITTATLCELVDSTCYEIADQTQGKRILDRAGIIAGIKHLQSKNEKDVVEVVVRWLGYFWNSSVCGRSDNWTLAKSGNVAFQMDAHDPAKVSEVFARLREADGASLPSSQLVHQIGADTTEHPELVSDSLPKRFAYTDELRPGWLMCVDKGEVRYVDLKKELNTSKFLWRVRMKIDE